MIHPGLIALSLLIFASSAAAKDQNGHDNARRDVAAPTKTPPPRTSVASHFGDPALSSARLPVVANMDFGVGLYSIGGHFVRDRQTNGREPILGTSGRDNRIAAVGLSLRF
jgi:hypothetical protein